MTYDWEFSTLDCVIGPDSEGNEDIVNTVHWRLTAREGAYAESEYSSLGVTYTEGDPFIPYEDLTPSDVQGWCEEGLDVDAMKARLRARVELAKNPINATLDPPWLE
tara:strand:- start:86 stop:406 length:321 start_codon:yes stop_codon:yes gene_type:complete